MPKALEQALEKESRKKNMKGKQKQSFIFGTMRKAGWVPSTQKKKNKKKRYI